MGTFLGNGYAMTKATWTLDGSTKIFQSTWMVKNDTAASASSIDNVWRTNWTTAGKPFVAVAMYSGWTLARTETYRMLGGELSYWINETPVIGTKVNSLGTPVNTSILVRKVTGIVGKRYRGRWMLPNFWIPEAEVSQAGIISGAGITILDTLWGPSMVAQLGGPHPLVLGHTTSEITPTLINTYTINPKIGSMPHRIRGY